MVLELLKNRLRWLYNKALKSLSFALFICTTFCVNGAFYVGLQGTAKSGKGGGKTVYFCPVHLSSRFSCFNHASVQALWSIFQTKPKIWGINVNLFRNLKFQ